MKATHLSRRTRFLIQWVARLALLAYIFQVGAFDHWHSHEIDLTAASTHSAHCHGVASGCADGGGLAGTLAEVPLTAIAPAPLFRVETPERVSVFEVFLPAPEQPPRSA